MKPHIIIKFLPGIISAQVPHWVEVIENNIPAPVTIGHDIDRIFRHYNIPVWVTHEYSSQAGRYNSAEIEAGLDRVYRFILQQDISIPVPMINDIQALRDVEYARPGAIGSAHIPPTHAMDVSSAMDRSRDAIFLKQAHLFSSGEASVKIAVLDTGVDLDHPELEGKLTDGYDFVDIINGADEFIGDYLGYDAQPADEVGHGTHVAGIISGKGINMPKGVAPGCKIMPVRVLGAMQSGDKKVGAGLVDNINTAIKWAVDNGADVINMSLGVKHEQGGLPHEEVVKYALQKGVTIVAASGNDGRMDKYYPGALPGVIAVAAVDENDQVAPFPLMGFMFLSLLPVQIS